MKQSNWTEVAPSRYTGNSVKLNTSAVTCHVGLGRECVLATNDAARSKLQRDSAHGPKTEQMAHAWPTRYMRLKSHEIAHFMHRIC